MAQYLIEHACGHEEWRQIYGPVSARDSKRQWWQKKPCTDCWREEQDAARAAARAATPKPEPKPEPKSTPVPEITIECPSIRFRVVDSRIFYVGRRRSVTVAWYNEFVRPCLTEIREALAGQPAEVIEQAVKEAEWGIIRNSADLNPITRLQIDAGVQPHPSRTITQQVIAAYGGAR